MNTTIHTSFPATNAALAFTAQQSLLTSVVLQATDRLGDQVLVPQARCVDILLDVYLATDDIGLKWSIAERINDLKGRKTVRVEDIRADLDAIVAIAAESDALELAYRAA
jgi:hypothetical protein